MRVEIKVLGPLEVSVGGVSIVPTASKPSQLLAMLALNAGHVVTQAALTDEIWDYQPPRSGVPTLHTYILKLRRKLAGRTGRRRGRHLEGHPHHPPRPATCSTWSRATSTPSATTGCPRQGAGRSTRATTSVRRGRWARRCGCGAGTALADVPTGPQLAIEAMRLEENRLGDLHLRIEADLRLGRHHQLLGELATLCARHPLLENFCAQHMVALYRSGRQSQALEAYLRLRSSMVEQLGVEPSPRVRELHHGILTRRNRDRRPELRVQPLTKRTPVRSSPPVRPPTGGSGRRNPPP